MKDQASLNLLIVDNPIDSKALTGHLMLRATSSGLKLLDETGTDLSNKSSDAIIHYGEDFNNFIVRFHLLFVAFRISIRSLTGLYLRI